MHHFAFTAVRSAKRSLFAALLLGLLGAMLLSGCRLREPGQEDLVIPELVRTHI